jgi:hypothetical protein
MSRSRSLVFAFALLSTACGSQPAPTPDASADAGPAQDASPMTPDDGGSTTPADGGSMMPADGGGSVMTGVCGAMTRDCICACGMNGQCQNQCIGSNMACSQCVVRSQAACCPMQAQAVAQCAQAAQMPGDGGMPCMTQACLLMRCATEVQALQSCFATAQASDMRCQAALGECFGSYPLTCN